MDKIDTYCNKLPKNSIFDALEFLVSFQATNIRVVPFVREE